MEPSFDYRAQTHGEGHPNAWPCRLAIATQTEARRLATASGATHVLSIKSPAAKDFGPAEFPPERRLIAEFDDTVDMGAPGAPTRAQIDRIVDWVDALPEDARLMVHCLQGVHRSPAVALGLLAQQTDPLSAAKLLHALRPNADPNRLIVRLFDKRIGLDGDLDTAAERFPIREWKADERIRRRK